MTVKSPDGDVVVLLTDSTQVKKWKAGSICERSRWA